DIEGNNATGWVYLSNKLIYLMKHCCDSVGLIEEFKSKKMEAYMFLNKEGVCKTSLEKNDKNSRYSHTVRIDDFLKPDEKSEEFGDDKIPF
ncbi:hypothetical protein LCGC14_2966390, partial [marine sediment metagenome]